MRDLEYITPDAYELASTAPLTASFNAASTEVDADHVAEMARADMVRRFGDAAYTDGYTVKLTVDSEKQREATLA
ncbi:peptidoglycan synthetase, partial [Klebsiella pneumoniae]